MLLKQQCCGYRLCADRARNTYRRLGLTVKALYRCTPWLRDRAGFSSATFRASRETTDRARRWQGFPSTGEDRKQRDFRGQTRAGVVCAAFDEKPRTAADALLRRRDSRK